MSDGQVFAWCAFVIFAAAVAFGWGYVIGRDSGRRPEADRAPLLVHQALVAQVRDYLPVHAELARHPWDRNVVNLASALRRADRDLEALCDALDQRAGREGGE